MRRDRIGCKHYTVCGPGNAPFCATLGGEALSLPLQGAILRDGEIFDPEQHQEMVLHLAVSLGTEEAPLKTSASEFPGKLALLNQP